MSDGDKATGEPLEAILRRGAAKSRLFGDELAAGLLEAAAGAIEAMRAALEDIRQYASEDMDAIDRQRVRLACIRGLKRAEKEVDSGDGVERERSGRAS